MERTTDWTMDKNHKISIELKSRPKEMKKKDRRNEKLAGLGFKKDRKKNSRSEKLF